MTPKEMAATSFTVKTKLPKTGGVYLLYCDGDEKGYIGSTNWLYRRFVIHRADLRHDRHGNSYLQRAYNKYGKASIAYIVLEVCEDTTPDARVARENYYMSQVDRSMLFNLVVPAVANGTHGIRPSDAVIANLIRNNKEHKWALGLQVSDEVRAAASARFKGKKHTTEQIAKRIQSRRTTMAIGLNYYEVRITDEHDSPKRMCAKYDDCMLQVS